MATDDQQFCLRWNNHQSTLISVFDTLLESGTLVDCTLAAEGQFLKAHKVVLSACSPYLELLLSQHYEKHPIVILKDVKFQELKSMMDYMYRGEVNISQDQLGTFLKAAESLQIKGLSDNGDNGDARDVGSTGPKKEPPPRKVPPVATPPIPQRNMQNNINRPAQNVPPRVLDVGSQSPSHGSREDSMSPSLRKRRRIRRNSQGSDIGSDSILDTTSNSCDLPSQAQSTPISAGVVPSIPATMTPLVPSISAQKSSLVIEQTLQTETLNRLDTSMNSLPPSESGLLKAKIEPPSEELLQPKTEYLEDINNDDSVEDLTLDDDDDMDASQMGDMSRPGPSHGGDGSNQGFAPWHLSGNQTGSDEVFMAAQEAVGAHRDSQGQEEPNSVVDFGTSIQTKIKLEHLGNQLAELPLQLSIDTDKFLGPPLPRHKCDKCSRSYMHFHHLVAHQRYECGKDPTFECHICGKKFRQKQVLYRHIRCTHFNIQSALQLYHQYLTQK